MSNQYNPILRPIKNLDDVYNYLREQDRHIKMQFRSISQSGVEDTQVIVHTSAGVGIPAPAYADRTRSRAESVTAGPYTAKFTRSMTKDYNVIVANLQEADGTLSNLIYNITDKKLYGFTLTIPVDGVLTYLAIELE